MELIFESRSNLSDFSGTLQFIQWQPEVHQEPVLLPDTPVDRLDVSSYGSVIRDGGIFRMWYQATPEDWAFNGDVSWVAYAESVDGYHWKKPALGLINHPSGDNHLCNLGLHSPSVFIDPEAAPSERYRAVGCGRPGPGTLGLRYGYYSAVSADGLQWHLPLGKEPQWEGGDVITSVYHPHRRSACIALKRQFWINRLLRRCIHMADYREGVYGPHHGALYPDEYDDIASMQRGYLSGDYYGMGMLPAGEGMVGFLWNFRHRYPYSGGILLGNHGSSDVTLVYQEKAGEKWLHCPGRPNFFSHRDVPWAEGGWIHTSAAPIEVGDEHRLYFSGKNYDHGFAAPTQEGSEQRQKWVREEGVSGITFARWPKYRLFGFEAPRRASFRITVPIDEATSVEIYLNYRVRKGGRIRVGIDGLCGYDLEDCNGLYGDAVKEKVTWQRGDSLLLQGVKEICLVIELEMAAIYAYEVNRNTALGLP